MAEEKTPTPRAMDFGVNGHQWRVQFDDADPPRVLWTKCLKCGGTPDQYATGAPGEYRPCPES